MNKQFILLFFLMIIRSTYTMETFGNKHESPYQQSTESQLIVDLAKLKEALSIEIKEANIIQKIKNPELKDKSSLFSFHEKIVAAKLAKIAQLIESPRKFTCLKLILDEIEKARDEIEKARKKRTEIINRVMPTDLGPRHFARKRPFPFLCTMPTINDLIQRQKVQKPVYVPYSSTALVSSDNQMLISASSQGEITIRYLSNLDKTIATFGGKNSNDSKNTNNLRFATPLILTSDNNTLFCGLINGAIEVWDISMPNKPNLITILDKSKNGHSIKVSSLILSSNNKTLFSAAFDGLIKIWNISHPKAPFLTDSHDTNSEFHTNTVTCLKLSNNNDILFCGLRNGKIAIWNVSNIDDIILINHINLISTVTFNVVSATSLSLSSDNKTLFAGTSNGDIIIWDTTDLYNPREIIKLLNTEPFGKKSEVPALALGPDNKILYSGSRSGFIKIWDVANVQEAEPLHDLIYNGHLEEIYSLVLSSDNKILFTGSRDNTIKIWDLTKINVPNLGNYISKLPTSNQEIIEYSFIAEILDHRNKQIQKGIVNVSPLVITLPLLKKLFDQLPEELKAEMLNKKYVAFSTPEYKPVGQKELSTKLTVSEEDGDQNSLCTMA